MLACGSAEENFANNQTMERLLRAQGYPVELHTTRDVHTWTCWRDTLAQSLGPLIHRAARCGPRRFRLPILVGVMEINRTGVNLRHVDCETGAEWRP